MKIIILITFLFSFNLYAQENSYSFKIAGAYTLTKVSKVQYLDRLPLGGGLSTHVGYRFNKWEFNMSSYVNFAQIKEVRVQVNNSTIKGDGNFQSITFGPTSRYYFVDQEAKLGTPYILSGAHMVMQSMKFGVRDVKIDGGYFNHENKLTFEGYGLLTGLGMNKTKKKNKESYYFEVAYIANRSRKTSEVGGTNTQVRLIHSESAKIPIFEQTVFISVGLILF